jgi:sarcosine oxidase, subunit alpha
MSGHRFSGRGRLNASAVVSFTFDGKVYQGFAGESSTSALLASGKRLFGRSFKYHRPRGLVGAGSEEPNALVSVDRGEGRFTPNLLATQVELHDGLVAVSQNRWPSLDFDMGSINDRLSMFFPAGFYSKTFMWPRSFWEKLYEPAIRRLAGLGEPLTKIDPDIYSATYEHCDLLIVGADPAGIDAALEASGKQQRVILIDEQNEIGGGALSDTALWGWLKRSQYALEESGIAILTHTTAIGYYHDNFIAAVGRLTDHLPEISATPREKLWRIRADKVILAQGAIERPLVFYGNDTPDVMMASAAQTYLNRYGTAVGQSVALMASHDSGWNVAFDHADAGISVAAIVDIRSDVARELVDRAKALGIPVMLGSAVTAVNGGKTLSGIEITDFASGRAVGKRSIACDALLMAGAWTPSIHLWSHSKGSIKWDDKWGAYVPDEANENCLRVGRCAGT